MENKKEKLTFSKIEILFMIVLVALLMTAGVTVFTITTNKQLEKNLKSDAIHLSRLALDVYAHESMLEATDNIVVGSDGTTKGLCITAKALDENSELDGYFVVEETSTKQRKVSVWLTDGKLVIDGFTSDRLEKLNSDNGITKYNNNEFTKRVETSFIGATKDNGGFNPNPNRYETKCITEKIE